MQMYWIATACLALAVLVLARAITSAALQTRAYYALHRQWYSHWPFKRGKGLPRMLRPLLKAFVPAWVQVEPGVKMRLDANDLISRVILETGVWDEATWFAMQQHLGPGSTFVDIGAHDGYCSLKAARVVGLSGQVIAVEPNPEMVVTVRDNLRASGAQGISVVPVACSDRETTLTLFVAAQSNTGSSSFSEANASQYGQAGQSYQVPTRTLDTVLREAGVSRVDVVKIDVEGAEFLVLKGAVETLARYHPVLLVELDDSLLGSMGTSSAEITEFLRLRGYSVRGPYDEANFEFYMDAKVPAVSA